MNIFFINPNKLQPRGNDIFSTAGTADDSMKYFTLSYANGPGRSLFSQELQYTYSIHLGFDIHRKNNARVDPTTIKNAADDDFLFPTTVPADLETHGGDDVGIWAIGPSAHLFSGVIEQNLIPHTMAYISCVGTGVTLCS